MFARRLLTAGEGGSIISPGDNVFAITEAPDGGWTQIQDPKAYHYHGYTYLGWIDGTSGATEVGAFDHATKTTSVVHVTDLGSPDNHDSPAVMVRDSDKRLLVAYGRANSSQIRLKISVNSLDTDPTLSGGFGTEALLDAQIGATEYTYPALIQLRSVTDDPIYLFFRDTVAASGFGSGHIAYSKSTDGGATWGAAVRVFSPPAERAYRRVESNWTDRIDIFTTDRDPDDSNLYHFYLDGTDDSLHASNGTALTAPVTSSTATLVLAKTNGPAWSWGGSWDGGPATVIMQNKSGDNRILTARWRSGAWKVDTVVESVGGQLGINTYGSGAAIHHTDPDTVYVARKDTKFEMWRYSSSDDGDTWTGTQLTSGSSVDNVWAEVPHFAGSGLRAVWLAGTYTSDTNFSFGISGAR